MFKIISSSSVDISGIKHRYQWGPSSPLAINRIALNTICGPDACLHWFSNLTVHWNHLDVSKLNTQAWAPPQEAGCCLGIEIFQCSPLMPQLSLIGNHCNKPYQVLYLVLVHVLWVGSQIANTSLQAKVSLLQRFLQKSYKPAHSLIEFMKIGDFRKTCPSP